MGAHRIRAAVVSAVLAALAAISTAAAAVEQCPYNAKYVNLSDGDTLTCTCPAVQAGIWQVYGTDRYAADSDLCSAALHAGAIPKEGGEVTVFGGPGCGAYLASERNGISSREYGAYAPSIAFANPPPACGDEVRGMTVSVRLMAECLGRGEDAAYCKCELESFLGTMDMGLITILHGINDAMTRDQRMDDLASNVADILRTKGLTVEALPELKSRVEDLKASVHKACAK